MMALFLFVYTVSLTCTKMIKSCYHPWTDQNLVFEILVNFDIIFMGEVAEILIRSVRKEYLNGSSNIKSDFLYLFWFPIYTPPNKHHLLGIFADFLYIFCIISTPNMAQISPNHRKCDTWRPLTSNSRWSQYPIFKTLTFFENVEKWRFLSGVFIRVRYSDIRSRTVARILKHFP